MSQELTSENNTQLNVECTNRDLSPNDAIDGMKIFNCGFKFQNSTHADAVQEYEVWPDNLVQQQGQANFTTDEEANC